MGDSGAPSEFENVANPFCGLLCDDVAVTRNGSALKVTKSKCATSVGFERTLVDAKPQVAGKDTDLDSAIQAAIGLVKKSCAPLYGGLSTDVEGVRAVMALADRSRGTVDHAYGALTDRNYAVLQSAGWILSTLTETRNRADVIIVAGCDIHKTYPCFFDRIVNARESMFEETPSKRTVVFIGDGLDQSGAVGDRIGEVVTLACPVDQVDKVLSTLLARLRGNQVAGGDVAGVPLAEIDGLAERLRNAAYSVAVWSASSLKVPEPGLSIHTINEIVKVLNETTRAAGLSLSGSEGTTTANSVCAWQSGFPLPVSYASGAPKYDPMLYSIERQLKDGEGDLLLWVASFSPDLSPPDNGLPMIVLGTPGLKLSRQPDVFIPVGTPGVDHAGQLIRCDSVVTLPLQNLGRSQYPSAAQVLKSILAAL